ncbi:glycoside hydrolase family 1 protein [Sorangium sp. So ce854]|uniref:glycoside hydrolase family 1 protein n=1 Tax=Sorangium sp. So ce854 TaxID=3133322 RepID=UPI003F62392F
MRPRRGRGRPARRAGALAPLASPAPLSALRAPRALAALPLLALAAAACSSAEAVAPAPPPLPDIGYGAPGSLSAPSGKGGFRLGAASAATQIEDRNPSTDWYVFTRPEAEGGLGRGAEFVGDASRGYSKAIEDVALLREMGLDSYRFSVEWARIEPRRDVIDEEALAHYDRLLDALVAAGIRPVVTLHHFSSPVWLDDPRDTGCASGPGDDNLCGFGHPEGGPLVIEEMAEHAALLAARFGDRVDDWGTLNEPFNYLLAAYGVGVFPPGKAALLGDLLGEFVPVLRDYLLAHAAAYRALKEADTVDADGDGEAADVGLSLSVAEWVPARSNQESDDPEDVGARDRMAYVYNHLVVDAVLGGALDSDLDGEADLELPGLGGTLDWLGVQHYFRAGVTGDGGLVPVLNLTPCVNGLDFGACVPPVDPTFCVPAMRYEHNAPGLYKALTDLGARYPGLPLVVTESGIATRVGERRAEVVVRALEQIERARGEGVDVRGYYHWSLYDNFEWAEGFAPRFGLYAVDYETYERTPTEGAEVLGEVARGRALTGALRARYGGEGPMTPEPEAEGIERCSGS